MPLICSQITQLISFVLRNLLYSDLRRSAGKFIKISNCGIARRLKVQGTSVNLEPCSLNPVPCSYLHIMEIISTKYIISSTTYKQCPPPDRPEYAFIGRSNVGKSSLINMLMNKKGLAKTSATPGKTQLINHFLINENWQLVDLPGYG